MFCNFDFESRNSHSISIRELFIGMLASVALLSCGPNMVAQLPNQNPSTTSSQTDPITGGVVDRYGRPLSNVVVFINDSLTPLKTDSSGKFSSPPVAGKYEVSIVVNQAQESSAKPPNVFVYRGLSSRTPVFMADASPSEQDKQLVGSLGPSSGAEHWNDVVDVKLKFDQTPTKSSSLLSVAFRADNSKGFGKFPNQSLDQSFYAPISRGSGPKEASGELRFFSLPSDAGQLFYQGIAPGKVHLTGESDFASNNLIQVGEVAMVQPALGEIRVSVENLPASSKMYSQGLTMYWRDFFVDSATWTTPANTIAPEKIFWKTNAADSSYRYAVFAQFVLPSGERVLGCLTNVAANKTSGLTMRIPTSVELITPFDKVENVDLETQVFSWSSSAETSISHMHVSTNAAVLDIFTDETQTRLPSLQRLGLGNVSSNSNLTWTVSRISQASVDGSLYEFAKDIGKDEVVNCSYNESSSGRTLRVK